MACRWGNRSERAAPAGAGGCGAAVPSAVHHRHQGGLPDMVPWSRRGIHPALPGQGCCHHAGCPRLQDLRHAGAELLSMHSSVRLSHSGFNVFYRSVMGHVASPDHSQTVELGILRSQSNCRAADPEISSVEQLTVPLS